jgi:Holliday junction resolvasome RuvABC ATP-dependent DNA helicase subunit
LICLGRREKTIDDLAANADSRWKLPLVIKLNDYSDDELLQILIAMIKHRKMEVEGGSDSFYLRVLVRRVARSRGSSVFGNVRSLENALDKVCERQALRLRGEWSEWSKKNGSKNEEDKSDEGKGEEKGKEKSSLDDGETPEENTIQDERDNDKQSVEKGQEQTEEKAEEIVQKKAQEEVEEEVSLEQSSTIEEKTSPDDEKPKNNLLTKEDIFGPEPSDIRDRSTAWKELQSMIGLESVKSAVEELLTRAKANYDREIEGKEPIQTNLNRVFLGPPGSGKTTVAGLYGRILADLGLLSSGDLVMKTPADLLSNNIGESELNTKNALDAAQGKVLILDDAHMLYKSSGHGTDDTDSFRVGIIDTLVAKIPSAPGDDRCVILVGYEDRMKEMFRNCNPGLQRRFPLEDSFIFENYNEVELGKILELKLNKEQVIVNDKARQVAQEVLNRMRIRPNFGNGGDIDNLLGRAKIAYRKRISASTSKTSESTQITLEPEDFDPDYDRASRGSRNCKALFDNFVGFDKIIKQFQGYQRTAANMRRHDIDPRPHIPWTFVFKGPPGTGKTTTAKKVGQIFYDMGFLSSDEVITCSVSDIIGEYTGHTGPKVISQFERGLGKVLFIDEAYRLAPAASGGSGSFAAEAVGELVDAMTKPRYVRNMIVILAGYTEEMEFLMRSNQGLMGRFPAEAVFPHMQPEHCLKHLREEILKVKVEIWDKSDPGEEKRKKILRLFYKLSGTKSWSNGRDVETLARTIIRQVFDKEDTEETAIQPLTISTDRLIKFLQDLLRERKRAEIESESED